MSRDDDERDVDGIDWLSSRPGNAEKKSGDPDERNGTSDAQPPFEPGGGAGADAAKPLNRSVADLEPAPWWTTPARPPLDSPKVDSLVAAPAEPEEPEEPEEPATNATQTTHENGATTTTDVASGTPESGAATESVRPNTTRRLLFWIGAVLLGVIVLVGLFFLGQRLGGAAPATLATQTPTATPTITPTPTATAEGTVPQPAGVQAWNRLRGGECLQPYSSPWEEEFTVVDCASTHVAQLVYRGLFPGDEAEAFPSEAALAAQINLLCSAPGVIDLAAAGDVPDVRVQGSYPVTEEQWRLGERSYYCFVSRASGDPLTGSIAGPGPDSSD